MSRQAYVESITYKDPDTDFLKVGDEVEVSIFKAGTEELATLYGSRTGVPIANPIITGEDGLVEFWANTGDYDILFHDTILPERFGDKLIGWPSSPPNTNINADDLSDEGDIEWVQDPETGAWLANIKSKSVKLDDLDEDLDLNGDRIADGAVTSRKAKLTDGDTKATEDLALSGVYQDIPGASQKVTPDVNSYLKVTAVFDFENTEDNKPAEMYGIVNLNGADSGLRAVCFIQGAKGNRLTVSQVWRLTLAEGENMVKLRAKRNSGEGGKCKFGNTHFVYELIAA